MSKNGKKKARPADSDQLLTAVGFDSAYGKLSRETIKSTLKEFKKFGGILVSSDVLSVGTDLRFVSHMINYDFHLESLGLIQSISRICSNVDIQQITFFKNDIEHSSPAASILKEFNPRNL